MKRQMLLTVAFGFLAFTFLGTLEHVGYASDLMPPKIFQAAGPTKDSIEGVIDEYRVALGEPNNANAPGPLTDGRREINWDGGGSDVTTPPVTPFNVFLDSRGGQFTTLGIGLSQAPPSGGPEGGLETLFGNLTYGEIFSTFSAPRLFTPVGSNLTEARFFVPGTNGGSPATVRGFGAVFTDVDEPDGLSFTERRGSPLGASTLVECFDKDGKLIFSGFVPSSPGDGSLSFFGVLFEEAVIARVRIRTGNVAPGPNDGGLFDVVMMDDFFYSEPQPH
jgi:hypothetical protein